MWKSDVTHVEDTDEDVKRLRSKFSSFHPEVMSENIFIRVEVLPE